VFSGSRTQKTKPVAAAKGILFAAREGAAKDAWIRAGLKELLSVEGVERAGVWLEEAVGEASARPGVVLFRGEVWDRGNASVPAEWKRLSTDSPLPAELLAEKKSVEYEPELEKGGPILGPLVGLARALWIPITSHGFFRGLLLAGTARKNVPLPRCCAERVALELGFLLEYEEVRCVARGRQSDLAIWSLVEEQLARKVPFDGVLHEIAKSCTAEGSADGPDAVFALIGELKSGNSVSTPSAAGAEERLEILASSGESAWAHGVENGPLEPIWRRAVQDGMLISTEGNRLPLAKEISRLIAVPMEHDGRVSGVLIAGIGHHRSALETIQRIELRAQLASSVLSRVRREAIERRRVALEKALFDLSGEPVAIVDRDGFLVGMSRGARDLTKEREVVRGPLEERRFAQIFRPRDWEEVDHWQKSGFGSPGSAEGVFPDAQLRDGKRVRLRKLGIFQEQFVAVRFELLQPDDHARSLEEVEEEFQQVVAWMEEGVAVFDAHGRLRTHNARFLQMLGVPEREANELHTLEDVLRRSGKNAANPEEFATAWRALADGNNDGVKDELAMERPIAQVLERCTKAIQGKHGETLGRVEVYREMRGRNLFETRMAQTEQLALLGRRMTSVVHELSNPLTNILLLAQRLVRRDGDNAEHSDTQQILVESGRATAILREMLDLTREHRKERKLVSLNQVVAQSVELQRAMLAGSRIALRVDLEENLPHVEGDFAQLQQVLLNLLQNSQQAIEEGTLGSRIEVCTAHTEDGRVRLEVRDDGPGIPGFLRARIFDPFFTTKPPGLGTGLGLSIVLGFVRQHGGTVWAESQLSGGTRFVVELPVAHRDSRPDNISPQVLLPKQLPDAMQAKNSDSLHSSNGRLPNGLGKEGIFNAEQVQLKAMGAGRQSKPKILVVEDEPTVAGLIADVLREEGMQVDVLGDGSAALLQAERETYDLAICDLKMPGMDGQDFYRILGEHGNPLQEHVLFVTGDILAARSQKFLEEHRLAYVAKPFRMEELLHSVQAMLWPGQVPAEIDPQVRQVQRNG
jgi:signal transduction histidine kinase/CheY-like chemotaxis protein